MTPEELVRRLESLDHRERIATLVEHAGALDGSEAAVLASHFAAGDPHHRWLGLHVAMVRRDASLAMAALSDPSSMVRGLAARVVARHAAAIDEAIVDRLDARALRTFLIELDRARRTDLAEPLAAALVARSRLNEAARLLPRASGAWLERNLAVPWPEQVWTRLAARRTPIVVARLTRAFAESERPDLVWRSQPPSMWGALARHAPDAMATFIDRHADPDALPTGITMSVLRRLASRSASKVVGWLGTRIGWVVRHGFPTSLAERVRAVSDEELLPLCRGLAVAKPELLGVLLRRLPPPRRGLLFSTAAAELSAEQTAWPTELLAILPTAIRDREAARMLTLSRAATDGTWRRTMLGLRDVAAVRTLLEAEARSAQAEVRGEALAALVHATRRSRAGMAETLAFAKRIANEQDPVRLAVLGALSAVPGHHFDDPAAIEAVVAPIFDARDTSWETRRAAAGIGHALLVAHATSPKSPMFAMGLTLLERLAGHQGTPDLPRLDKNLPRGAEVAIVEVLRPWLEAARTRQQAQHVFAVCSCLGKRAHGLARLDGLVADILWNGHKNHAAMAAAHWLADPKTRDRRVRDLVKRDPSAVHLPLVCDHAHRRRQTLLVARFAPKAARGRFHDGKVVWIPTFSGGFHRWSTAVQQAYVALVRAAEAEPKQFSQTRAALVAMRAPIPITTVADLADAVHSKDVPTCEAALGALAHLDAPAAAVPLLLEHLDGDRARVAMYALPRIAPRVNRDALVELLAAVLGRPRVKVTVQKEALRLLGWAATPRAVELLEAQWSTDLHRDVRIAALHAARSLLAIPTAWALIERAAAHESPDVARAAVDVSPSAIAGPHRARYVAAMAAVVDHPDPEARAALFDALSAGWALADIDLAVRLAARVMEREDLADPASKAQTVLVEGARGASTHDAIVAVVTALSDASEVDVAPRGERDRLAHRRLLDLVDALVRVRHPVARSLASRLAGILLARPTTFAQGALLQLAGAERPAFGAALAGLCAAAPSPRLAAATEDAACAVLYADLEAWSEREASAAVDVIASGGPALRVMAPALLGIFGPRWGWGEAWAGRLARLRIDDDIDVRIAARGVWTVV
jgi:hypothetical protein